MDWRPVTEESQLNAWARAGRQIKLFMFFFLCFLVWPYVINILLTKLGRSIWDNLDLGRWYRPHSGDLSKHSSLQTSRSANKYKVILRLLGHTWILDYILLITDPRYWILYSLTVELGFRIPIVREIWIRRVEVWIPNFSWIRDSKTNNFSIPESELPYTGLFCSDLVKNAVLMLIVMGITGMPIQHSDICWTTRIRISNCVTVPVSNSSRRSRDKSVYQDLQSTPSAAAHAFLGVTISSHWIEESANFLVSNSSY